MIGEQRILGVLSFDWDISLGLQDMHRVMMGRTGHWRRINPRYPVMVVIAD